MSTMCVYVYDDHKKKKAMIKTIILILTKGHYQQNIIPTKNNSFKQMIHHKRFIEE